MSITWGRISWVVVWCWLGCWGGWSDLVMRGGFLNWIYVLLLMSAEQMVNNCPRTFFCSVNYSWNHWFLTSLIFMPINILIHLSITLRHLSTIFSPFPSSTSISFPQTYLYTSQILTLKITKLLFVSFTSLVAAKSTNGCTNPVVLSSLAWYGLLITKHS